MVIMLLTYGHLLLATGIAAAGIVWIDVVVYAVFYVSVCELIIIT